ncbi:MAG: DUF1800 family protein [Candidatus Hydrogenedentales bacterium]
MGYLTEYVVNGDGPWGAEEVAHLYRRAAFGGTTFERDVAQGVQTQSGLRMAVDRLVDFAPEDPHLDRRGGGSAGYGAPLHALPNDESDLGQVKHGHLLIPLQAHWLYRMRYTTQPFQEMFTLFLHNHMPTEWDKVFGGISRHVIKGNNGSDPNEQCSGGPLGFDQDRRKQMVYDVIRTQNYLYRQTGIDSFHNLLMNITRDPCMLLYLDNVDNQKGRPQENFARELMELFSMGVDNGYTETDIQEIAKVLTGETLPFRDCDGNYDYRTYGFDPSIHEGGNKAVFGRIIQEDFNGGETEQLIDLILEQVSVNPDVRGLPAPYNDLPAVAVFMSWKILRWFVSDSVQLYPVPDEPVLELAHYMRGTDNAPYPARRYPYDLRACMRKVFLSKYFFAPENRYTMIKSPTDFYVTTLRGLELDDQFSYINGPGKRMQNMGMELFEPPNVSGWRGGEGWVSAGKLVERFNYGDYLFWHVMSRTAEFRGKWGAWLNNMIADPTTEISGVNDIEGMIDFVCRRLLHQPPNESERTQLKDFLVEFPSFRQGMAKFDERMRCLLHLVMSMPRFQLK